MPRIAPALSLLSVVLATVAVAQPLDGARVGINVHAPGGDHRELLLDRVAATGAGWIRIDFIWAWIEPLPGFYVWEHYDRLISSARARGLQVLAIAAYTPEWASDGSEVSGVPRQVTDWQSFCFEAASRYRGRVAAWEVWNEPNLPRFWGGSREQYFDVILLPGIASLRAGDPDARIGGPGLAHRVDGDADWPLWLSETLERAGGLLDFVSHHVYDSDGHTDVSRWLDRVTPFGRRPEGWTVVPPSVRELLDHHGFLGHPFWLTETGFGSRRHSVNGPISEAWQASQVAGLLRGWLGGDPERSWIDKIFLYEIQDGPGAVVRFGLLHPDGSPKPVYHVVQGLLRPAGVPDEVDGVDSVDDVDRKRPGRPVLVP